MTYIIRGTKLINYDYYLFIFLVLNRYLENDTHKTFVIKIFGSTIMSAIVKNLN